MTTTSRGMRRRREMMVLLASLHAGSAAVSLSAQQTDSVPAFRASFSGRVVSSVDSAPVRQADVRIVFLDSTRVIRSRAGGDSLELFTDSARSRVGVTDSLVAFAIRRVETGQYLLYIRRIGFTPLQGVLNADTSHVSSTFVMQQTSKTLAAVVITESARDRVKERLERIGFTDRKRFRTIGTFIDRAEILKRRPLTVRDLLARYGVYQGEFVIDRMPTDFEVIRDYPAGLVIGVEIYRHGRPAEFGGTRNIGSIMSGGGLRASRFPLVLIWTYIP